MADRSNQFTGAVKQDVGISLDEVHRLVDQKLAGQMGSSARDAYAAQKMSDLPVTYRSLMPPTSDQAELSRAEQRIRSQYRDDMLTEVPKHVQTGRFVGADSSPEAIAFHQKMGDAQAAFDRGDLATAARLTSELQATQAGNPQQQAAPVDVSKLSASDKILYGLQQERAAAAGGKTAAPAAPAQPARSNQPADKAAWSKLSAGQKIALGLREEGFPRR